MSGSLYHFGDDRAVAPKTHRKNLIVLTSEGEIVALGKSGSGADMTYLGLDSVNNDGQLWHARRIHGEIAQMWRFDSPHIGTLAGQRGPCGIAYETSTQGCVAFGPCCELDRGAYRAEFHFDGHSTIVGLMSVTRKD